MTEVLTDALTVIQNGDSDYGTWSSSSSDHCCDLQNLGLDLETSFGCQTNNNHPVACSCCSETVADLSFLSSMTLKVIVFTSVLRSKFYKCQ